MKDNTGNSDPGAMPPDEPATPPGWAPQSEPQQWHPGQQPPQSGPQPPPWGPPPQPQAPFEPAADGRVPSRRRSLLIAAATALLAIPAGTGIGAAMASGDDSDSGLPLGAPSSTTAGSPVPSGEQDAPREKKKGRQGKKGKQTVIRGTIAGESGSTWTVKTSQGKTIKITITAQTRFGTMKSPGSKSDFTVGEPVAVVVQPGASGDTVTAQRIRTPANNGAGGKRSKGAPTRAPASPSAPSSSPS